MAEGLDGREPIRTLPGIDRLSVAEAVGEAGSAAELGIPAVLLFGIPATKDAEGTGAYDDDGIVQLATRAIKQAHPELLVITDLCLCEYTDHGHCGVVREVAGPAGRNDYVVDNDATLELLARTAVSQAQAGADVIGPSDMMDGRIGAIREALDDAGLHRGADHGLLLEVRLGLLRAVPRGGRLSAGVRRPPQLPDGPANGTEAVRESLLDVEEGADLLMVKPALPYLDVIRRVKDATQLPLVAYNTGGEYSMLKAAAAAGYMDERQSVLEALTGIKRAGADIIITYHAKDAAQWLK